MKPLASMLICLIVLVGPAAAMLDSPADPGADPSDVRFVPLDILIDTGESDLAAWQFELSVTSGDATIVGVEGGEHAAFREAPYYDPAALSAGRIIVAAFSTAEALPSGSTRIARLHMRVAGEPPEYAIQLIAAASPGGERISATLSIEQGDES